MRHTCYCGHPRRQHHPVELHERVETWCYADVEPCCPCSGFDDDPQGDPDETEFGPQDFDGIQHP